MVYQGSFDYCEDTLQTLYARHKIAGLDVFGDYTSFRHSVIDFIDDDFNFLFNVYLKNDRFKDDFLQDLNEEGRQALAGIIALVGLNAEDFGLADISPEPPDICLEEMGGSICLSTFEDGDNYLLEMADWAFNNFRENATVDDFKVLDDKSQALFLKLDKLLGRDDMEEEVKERMHKRMVFGLHIPQDLKDYHEECAKELALRIMTNPLLAHTLETFLNRKKRVDDTQIYFQNEQDKRFFASLLMTEMADIWDIPRPFEEEYVRTPEKDKAGEVFATFMVATFRKVNEDDAPDTPNGLVYKINADGGYLTEANENFYTIASLGHEFGHLVSNFIVHGKAHEPWSEDKIMSRYLKHSPVMKIGGLRDIFVQNNTADTYYEAVEADFSDLPETEGKHKYAGQYEERHANYVGDLVRKMTEFALKNKKSIRNFEGARQSLQFDLAVMMTKNKMNDLDMDTCLKLQQDVLKAKTFDELHQALGDVIMELADWIDSSIQGEEKTQNKLFAKVREPILEKRALKFANDLEDFAVYVELLFEMHERVMDADYKPRAKEENSLSYG